MMLMGTQVPSRSHYSMRSHRAERRPIYTIDSLDRLVEVNQAFIESLSPSSANPGASALIGRSIWDFVEGSLPRQLWRVLYGRVRSVDAPIFVPLRADDANHRCLIDLELHPVGDRSIRHVRECVSFEARPSVALLDSNYPRDERVLNRCAWCARVQVSFGRWQEVEEAYVALDLAANSTLPTLRAAACEPCKQSILKNFPARVA
jgi:hypothetical protein